jgi:hypothetical protein
VLTGFLVGLGQSSQLKRPGWPAMVPYRALTQRPYPVARRWALDSGAFALLLAEGRWTVTARHYADVVRRWRDVAGLEWAATQDWLCAPAVLAATGLSVAESQRRTVASWHELRALAPDVQWVPTVQGWHPEDYLACLDLYGPEIAAQPLVGVGSIAGRQGGAAALLIVHELAALGLPLHGWGVKQLGLRRYGPLLTSADSQSWSHEARRVAGTVSALCGADDHVDCRNCLAWADRWAQARQRQMDSGRVESHQLSLLTTK